MEQIPLNIKKKPSVLRLKIVRTNSQSWKQNCDTAGIP